MAAVPNLTKTQEILLIALCVPIAAAEYIKKNWKKAILVGAIGGAIFAAGYWVGRKN